MSITVYLIRNDNRIIRDKNWLAYLPTSRRNQIQGLTRQEEKAASLAAGYLMYRYLGVVSDNDLTANPYGKPSLAAGSPCFNISHSDQYTALAVADTEVGVDIEPEDVKGRLLELPLSAFSEDEIHWLDDHPDPTDFALLWTKKEAVLKADGRGFGLDPKSISVLRQLRFSVFSTVINMHVVSCATTESADPKSNSIKMKEIL